MAKTLVKQDIQTTIAEKLGISNAEAAKLVELFFEGISAALERGEIVKLTGFGNFTLRRKPARPGRNPRTGEPKEISERTVVTFHPTQKLLARLDNT